MAVKKAKKKIVARKAAAPVHHREKADHSPVMQIGVAFIIIAALLLMFYVGQYYSK